MDWKLILSFPVFLTALQGIAVQADVLGKFIVHNTNSNEGDQATFSVLNRPSSIDFAPNPNKLHANEVAPVLAVSLGLSIPQNLNWNGLHNTGFFDKPKALVVLNIDGLPQGLQMKLNTVAKFPIVMPGVAPDIPEILSLSTNINLASHINYIFEGKSVIASISTAKNVALATGSYGEHAKNSFWNEKGEWQSISANNPSEVVSLTTHQVMKRIPEILPTGFTYDAENSHVLVNAKDLQVTFNLRNKIDFTLFSELVYMMYHNNELDSSLVKDGIPDVYTLSFSSLKQLEARYGSNSKQMKAAILLLDLVVPQIVTKFKDLYDDNVFIVALTMKSDFRSLDEKSAEISKTIEKLNEKSALLPHQNQPTELHIADEMTQDARQKLCESIQMSILPASLLKFKCAHSRSLGRVKRAVDASDDDENYNVAISYDSTYPVIFNIILWLMIFLALTVYAISVVMWNMDPGRDSVIYRLTQQKIRSD